MNELISLAIVSFIFGFSSGLIPDKEPKEVVVNQEIETPWIEFRNGLIKDLK